MSLPSGNPTKQIKDSRESGTLRPTLPHTP
jgi:hypothetical protein